MKCKECRAKVVSVSYYSVVDIVHATFLCEKGHTFKLAIHYLTFNRMRLPDFEYDMDLQI